MMSNSNYSIGLQRLKPVQAAYCACTIWPKIGLGNET